ncbi:hypothetical protein [Vitiosangium sp. GDMCC 1.1324]|uniref:hypothetical protein n=1 Tax=Vitiosangium sp. (strain GDMCC 1.1324) TaxID=2138576 RepID=UPI000D35EA70|nr:hypothetical protein [Vitiosangium sp. GDMCC 1.1324]PTL82279.1 hypothetical protein DAT35_21055 [Vitiosangium sp. GDMCC 1.1324]
MKGVCQRPAARALLLVVLSFIGWGSWTLASDYRPLYGGLTGYFSDQVSHMSAALLLGECGTRLWSQPAGQLMRRYSTEELRQLPDDLRPHVKPGIDLFVRPGGPLDKPLVLNWPRLPRPYPPGALVLAAPTALAYHFTSLSFSSATRLLDLSYLLYAHVGFFFLLCWLLAGRGQPSALGLLGGLLLYSESIHWALEGFYDVALLAPLALCGHFLFQRRGLAALVCYCAAAFIHYRAYFFAPLALYALYLAARDWKQRPWGARQWLALGAITVLGGASLYTFWLTWPWLTRFPLTNVLQRPERPAIWHVLLTSGMAAAALFYARAWMDLALTGWVAWMSTRIYQTQPWHVLSLLMWLALPVLSARPERVPVVRDVRVVLLWVLSVLVYGQTLLPSRWMEHL